MLQGPFVKAVIEDSNGALTCASDRRQSSTTYSSNSSIYQPGFDLSKVVLEALTTMYRELNGIKWRISTQEFLPP